ncbi:hypothetical protein Tco_1512268, partial [Tanacetum coccineum]
IPPVLAGSYLQRNTVILQDIQVPEETSFAYQGDEPNSESIHWKSFGEEIGQLVIRLDKIQFNRILFHVFLYEMVADNDVFCSRVLDQVAGYGYG